MRRPDGHPRRPRYRTTKMLGAGLAHHALRRCRVSAIQGCENATRTSGQNRIAFGSGGRGVVRQAASRTAVRPARWRAGPSPARRSMCPALRGPRRRTRALDIPSLGRPHPQGLEHDSVRRSTSLGRVGIVDTLPRLQREAVDVALRHVETLVAGRCHSESDSYADRSTCILQM